MTRAVARQGRRRAVAVLAALLAALLAAPAPARALGLSEEQELGARFALEARRRLTLLREPAVTAYLRRVGNRLVSRLDSRTFSYRFYVVHDTSLNAFAVPGGHVYTNAGLLTGVASEAELAGVLGHEIVHVQAHHVVRQQEKTALVNYGTLLGLFLSAVHPALGASAVAAGAAVQLKYEREFEQEADHVGLDLVRSAGFDPRGLPSFLRTVQREQRLNPTRLPPYFLSHPLTEDRLSALEQRAESTPPPPPRPGGEMELAATQAIVRVLTGARGAAVPAYRERLARAPESAEAQHLLGLIYLYGGDADAAEPLLAAAAAGQSPRAGGDHGRALVRLGRHAAAREELEAHLRAYPDDPPITVELARLKLGAGELKASAALLESALAADPELDDAEYALAECRGKQGDARGQWWHLGRAFELRGEFDRALSAFDKARELSAEDSPEREEVEREMRKVARALGRVR